MTSAPAGAHKADAENTDAIANAAAEQKKATTAAKRTSGSRKENDSLPEGAEKPTEIAKQLKPTTNEGTSTLVDPTTGGNAATVTEGDAGSSDGSPADDVNTVDVIEVKRHATQDEISDPDVPVDPAGHITEQVKAKRATRTKKDTLKGIEDFSKLPVAVHVGQVAASVEEYSGRAVLSISLVGWVGEAPFKILAEDIDELEDAIANLRAQLA